MLFFVAYQIVAHTIYQSLAVSSSARKLVIACYKVFRTEMLKQVPLHARRFDFCPEITMKVLRRGHVIHEEPIAYSARTEAQGKKIKVVAIGSKGLGFMNRAGAEVVAQATGLGDTPHLDTLIGPSKVLFDAFAAGELSEVHLCFTRFVNTMRQEATVEQLLPLNASDLESSAPQHSWDYMYEPEPTVVIDDLMLRYVEAQVYQGVAENMASEQSARMVAMKAATDNAGTVISDLKLVYNKTRQAAITKELSEIVAGAAAV